MQMARAFIASVPTAIVLVAALVVPITVIPGTFAFHSWPSTRSEVITDRPVRETPQVVKVAPQRPQRATVSGRERATTNAGRRGTTPATSTSHATPRRQAANAVTSPRGSDRDDRHASARGPGHAPAPSVTPGAPSTPSSEPEPQEPTSGSQPGQIVVGDTPVLRDDQPETPAPPPSHVAPVTPVVPSPPAPGDDGDDCDHGPVRDVGHGHGLGHQRGLGLGHGHNGH
jgi:hypothetical protein